MNAWVMLIFSSSWVLKNHSQIPTTKLVVFTVLCSYFHRLEFIFDRTAYNNNYIARQPKSGPSCLYSLP